MTSFWAIKVSFEKSPSNFIFSYFNVHIIIIFEMSFPLKQVPIRPLHAYGAYLPH